MNSQNLIDVARLPYEQRKMVARRAGRGNVYAGFYERFKRCVAKGIEPGELAKIVLDMARMKDPAAFRAAIPFLIPKRPVFGEDGQISDEYRSIQVAMLASSTLLISASALAKQMMDALSNRTVEQPSRHQDDSTSQAGGTLPSSNPTAISDSELRARLEEAARSPVAAAIAAKVVSREEVEEAKVVESRVVASVSDKGLEGVSDKVESGVSGLGLMEMLEGGSDEIGTGRGLVVEKLGKKRGRGRPKGSKNKRGVKKSEDLHP